MNPGTMNGLLLPSLTVLLTTAAVAQARRVPMTPPSAAARVHCAMGVAVRAHAGFALALTPLDAAMPLPPGSTASYP
jgi:hypothetical protein